MKTRLRQEVPCGTNRNGPYKNDLIQGKSQVGFLGAEEPHLENADKVRWRGPPDAGQLWSSVGTRGLKFSAALWEQVVEEEYTLGPNPYLSGDVSRVKELLYRVLPMAFLQHAFSEKMWEINDRHQYENSPSKGKPPLGGKLLWRVNRRLQGIKVSLKSSKKIT